MLASVKRVTWNSISCKIWVTAMIHHKNNINREALEQITNSALNLHYNYMLVQVTDLWPESKNKSDSS